MSATWPPLDLHAHVSVDIDPTHLLGLRAVIFAATRSLHEACVALDRPADALAVWGVGVHPASAESLRGFDPDSFATLVGRTAYVSEIGLDGKVRARLDRQREVLREILAVLQRSPRITALHSYSATEDLLGELERTPIKGAILHWWTGDGAATDRALELGAYFSLNAACVRSAELISRIPLDRILTETDHPDGDRRSKAPRRPGGVDSVEDALSLHHRIDRDELRLTMWRNLQRLTGDVGCSALLPTRISAILGALPTT